MRVWFVDFLNEFFWLNNLVQKFRFIRFIWFRNRWIFWLIDRLIWIDFFSISFQHWCLGVFSTSTFKRIWWFDSSSSPGPKTRIIENYSKKTKNLIILIKKIHYIVCLFVCLFFSYINSFFRENMRKLSMINFYATCLLYIGYNDNDFEFFRFIFFCFVYRFRKFS